MPIICVKFEWIPLSILIYAVSKKNVCWTQSSKYIQQTIIINCYESLMSQIKKAYSILAKSEEFSMQLRHVNTLLDQKASRPALEFKLK